MVTPIYNAKEFSRIACGMPQGISQGGRLGIIKDEGLAGIQSVESPESQGRDTRQRAIPYSYVFTR